MTDTQDLKLCEVVIDNLLSQKYQYESMLQNEELIDLPFYPSLLSIENQMLRNLLGNLIEEDDDDREEAYAFDTRTGQEVI